MNKKKPRPLIGPQGYLTSPPDWSTWNTNLAVIGGYCDGSDPLPSFKLLYHGDLVAGDLRLLQLHVVAGHLQIRDCVQGPGERNGYMYFSF